MGFKYDVTQGKDDGLVCKSVETYMLLGVNLLIK